MSEHAKLEIKDDDKDFVIISGFPSEPTRLFLTRKTGYEIHRRWNCHDDLVAACEALMYAWIRPESRSLDALKTDMDSAYVKAKAVHAKAKPK